MNFKKDPRILFIYIATGVQYFILRRLRSKPKNGLTKLKIRLSLKFNILDKKMNFILFFVKIILLIKIFFIVTYL